MEKQPVVSLSAQLGPWAGYLNAYTTLIKERGYSPVSVQTQVQLITKFSGVAPEGAHRSPCPRRDHRGAILAASPKGKICTAWRCCRAVPVPPHASRTGSYSATEETASVFPVKTHYEFRTIPVRRTRPDTGNHSQLCALHRSVPLCTIPTDSHQPFSTSCSGCDGLRSAPGSQTQSGACAVARNRPSVFSSLSATPRKSCDGSGRLCAHRCPLVICDLAQVPPSRHRTKSAGSQ